MGTIRSGWLSRDVVPTLADAVLPAESAEGVRDAGGRRLSRLSDVCNSALADASVIGRVNGFQLDGHAP